jgi:hypothetical protein
MTFRSRDESRYPSEHCSQVPLLRYEDVDFTPPFEIRHLDPDQRLPCLVRKAA